MVAQVMLRNVLAFFVLSLALGGCGDHFTTQEAYKTCAAFVDRTLTENEAAFADCVDCHERCGNECEQSEGTDPEDTYACPEDL